MRRQVQNLLFGLLISSILTGGVASTYAAAPADSLLPFTTKGFVSIPSLEELSAKWNETQLGQLLVDPVMKPFVEDLRTQLQSKLSQTGIRLGVSWEDLDGVASGEVAVGAIQPDGDKLQHALVLIADISGRDDQSKKLLEKISKHIIQQGGSRAVRSVSGTEIVVFTIPNRKDKKTTHSAFYFVRDDMLVSADHEKTALAILENFGELKTKSLQSVDAYQSIMQRCGQAAGTVAPHIRWYVDPFGYAEVSRAAGGGRKKRGTDLLKVLANQGFTAAHGVGGQIAFATEKHELVHFTKIHAPAVPNAKGHKYEMAARMLEFPNDGQLSPQSWVPSELASYLTMNWKMKEAFGFSETLVDEIAGEKIFKDVLEQIEKDPNGPGVNLEREIIQHLGERFTLLTDNRKPFGPKSERYLIAVEITNAAVLARAIEKIMEKESTAKRVEIDQQIIWEVTNDEEGLELEAVKIDGVQSDVDENEEDKPMIPNSAIAVANGHLMIASHVDYIVQVLRRKADANQLATASDYQTVAAALVELGSDQDAFRFFVRTDEAYRTTYELMRQGRMPEAESLLGKFLNKLMAPEEKGAKREQQINAAKLPEFDAVKQYFGAGGLFVRSEDDGWFISGCLLSKAAEVNE